MTQNIDRQELAKKAHAASVAKGFWDEKHSQEHYLMFVVMDLSGGVEAHQVSHRADYAAHKRALIDPESKEGVIARSMGEARVIFITLDEKSGTERKTPVTMLIQSDTLPNALGRLQEELNKQLGNYETSVIKETPILEYYKYEPQN